MLQFVFAILLPFISDQFMVTEHYWLEIFVWVDFS